MASIIRIGPEKLKALHEQNPCLVSYNVEFAEVTGGTFWKAYTPGQIAGTEPFLIESDEGSIMSGGEEDLMQVYPPIDLYNEKLRRLTRELGTAWCRVSGSWATKTYYDFEGRYTDGSVPDGYLNVLTKEQWIGVLDFVRACGLKLMVSLANCPGLHTAQEPWPYTEAEKLFGLSRAYGVPISAAEFVNEPNMIEDVGFPDGYTVADYHRDADRFATWLREHYPECLYVGPSTTLGDNVIFGSPELDAEGLEKVVGRTVGCDDLMRGMKQPLDVFSYHYYNGFSDRLPSVMPPSHWAPETAASEAYLDKAPDILKVYLPMRDRYCPGGEIWVTESGDAAGGGNSWASTYLDVLRTLNELGTFSQLTRGVVFHNTLAASDYGFLARGVFDPRPNFFAVKLWYELMGPQVYDPGIPIREGAHIFVQSAKKDPKKQCWLIINNSETEETLVELPSDGEIYTLAGKDGNKRAGIMTLNKRDLVLAGDGGMPDLSGERIRAGVTALAPMTCTFLIV